jgi:DeoR family transcriptional regulator of aga operon
MVVGLTGGTTTTEVARVLGEMSRLTIVTNSLSIAAELAVRPNLKLVLTGGVARPESYELIGPLAEGTLSGLNLDLAIVGVDGISAAAGLTTHHEVEAGTNRTLIARAERTLVVADSSKIGRAAFARIVDAAAVEELITDRAADGDEVALLAELGLRVEAV